MIPSGPTAILAILYVSVPAALAAEPFLVKHNCFDFYDPADIISAAPKKSGQFEFGEPETRRFVMDLECDCSLTSTAIKQIQVNVDSRLGTEPMNPYAWAAAAEFKLKRLQVGQPLNSNALEPIQLARRAAELKPPTGRAQLALAKAELNAGDPFSAVKHLAEAMKLGVPQDESLFMRALISEHINNDLEAQRALEKVIEISSAPELRAIAAVSLGDLLRKSGKLDDAQRRYRSGALLQSCIMNPVRRLATLLLFEKGDPGAARSALAELSTSRTQIANARFLEIVRFFEWSREPAPAAAKKEKLARLLQQCEIRMDEVFLTAAQFDPGKDLVRDLLDAGGLSSVDVADGQSNTALILAGRGNAGSVAAELVARGAEVNSQNADGERAIGHFAGHGNIEAVKRLLENGAEPNYVDKRGNSPLGLAIAGSHIEMAKLLMQHGTKADLGTLLSRVALGSNLPMVQLLVSMGADVNASSESTPPPLLSAILAGDLPTIRFLLENNADPQASFRDRTVLDYSTALDRPDIVKLLSEKRKIRL